LNELDNLKLKIVVNKKRTLERVKFFVFALIKNPNEMKKKVRGYRTKVAVFLKRKES